jgi:hypothetical protein
VVGWRESKPVEAVRPESDQVGHVTDGREGCKDIAPSAALRQWYRHSVTGFPEFRDRYLMELDDPAHAEALRHLQALSRDNRLTLLTATKDIYSSHALVLAQRLTVPTWRRPAVQEKNGSMSIDTSDATETSDGSASYANQLALAHLTLKALRFGTLRGS